jgi:hypothetical protein
MEPWEKILVMSILIFIISLVTYSTFIYVPFHINKLMESIMSCL